MCSAKWTWPGHCRGSWQPLPQTRPRNRRTHSTTAHCHTGMRAPLAGSFAHMLLPHGLADHFVFVAGDVGAWSFVDEIEYDRNVHFSLCLAQIVREEPAHIFGERNA